MSKQFISFFNKSVRQFYSPVQTVCQSLQIIYRIHPFKWLVKPFIGCGHTWQVSFEQPGKNIFRT